MTRLHDLFDQQGQSPWLDNLCRDDIDNGRLADLIRRGVRGITSNPTIFHRSITSSAAYDDQIRQCRVDGDDVAETYWKLVTTDVIRACDLLTPLYEESSGEDGFVSLEVDPHEAHDSTATVRSALELAATVDRPNLMIKVPATDAGIGAIESLLARGISVNVTLIFGVGRYRQVLSAFRAGIEQLHRTDPARLRKVRSVASFFISRVDTTVDQQLLARNAGHLIGKTAICQAHLAYEEWKSFVQDDEWQKLMRIGAHAQRPLWASTSTKNPNLPELLYVEQLIGPFTVNTLPEATLTAFEERGAIARTLGTDMARAQDHLRSIEALGVDVDAVAERLETDGVGSFQRSFDDLIADLATRLS